MTTINDELAAMAAVPEGEQLKSIATLAQQAVNLAGSIETAEQFIRAAKSELHQLTNHALPDAMAAAHTKEFMTERGYKISINDFVSGSLPKDQEARAKALEWLKTNGAEDLIKNQLKVDFGRGQDNVAHEVLAQLLELGVDYDCERGVNHMSLTAYARERMRNGEPVPLELLGLYAGRSAKIKPPSS